MAVRMLVTGADGVVGGYVREVFGSEYDLDLTDKDTLDITDPRLPTLIYRNLGNIDVVLHLAAATDVDECERNPDLAWRTNALGTQNVAAACRKLGARMVYISTAGVFSGDQLEPYTEFDHPHPANVYGRAKLAGEILATELLGPDLLIVRAGWMFGGGLGDGKFVGMIRRQIENGATELRAVDDKIGSPTFAADLLRTVVMLLGKDAYGVFHGANSGVCSRYDVAAAVRDLLGSEAAVTAVSSSHFPLAAPRARSEAMDAYKARLLGYPPQRPWFYALSEYLEVAAHV